jgi:outer membrane protein TolC
MKKCEVVFCLLFLFPALAAAQSHGPVLSLDDAIHVAVENNRQLASSQLQTQKAEADVETARSKRLPIFQTEGTASFLVTPVSFAFPAGAFGDFAGIGQIPAVDTKVNVPQQPTYYMTASASQPLSKLYQINLGVKGARASRDLELERTRGQRLALVNDVKRLYFSILQTQSALAANAQAINLYRELDRTLQVRVAQQVALRSDALDIEFRLAQEELTKTSYENALATQKEQLNQLLGRDLATDFEVEDVLGMSIAEINLEAGRVYALDNRPDVREARIKVQQAEIDWKVTKADRLPEVNVAASYSSYFNIDVMPTNLASVGLQVKWEPFDWGRRSRAITSKSHTVAQARLALRETQDKTVLEVNSLYRTLAEKRALLRVVQTAQSAAREKLRVKTNQYRIEAVMLTDVLETRAELADADDRYQQALVAYWTAKADYDLATGEEGLK